MTNDANKERFNKQAENYSKWDVTSNIDYLNKYFEFCDIESEDTILDVACGSGDFTIFSAPKVKYAHGIDISDKLIEIAKKNAEALKIENIKLKCSEFETECLTNKYSIVVCRMAFHHFIDQNKIFKRMYDLCLPNGKIGIQDFVGNENIIVKEFFDKFEKYVDVSHNCSLTKNEFIKMYNDNNMKITKTMELDREISVSNYIKHAVQSKENLEKINELIISGLEHPQISQYLVSRNDEVYFKRKVFLILGAFL